MPVKLISVSTVELDLVPYDSDRTAIGVANNHDSGVLFISDEKGKGIEGFPVFPKSYLSIERLEGYEPEKQYWVISDTATTDCHVITAKQKTKIIKPPPDIQDPTGQPSDPPM